NSQITMNGGGTNSAVITSLTGNNLISSNIQIVTPTTISVGSGSTLTLNNGGAGAGKLSASGAQASLNIVGPGVLVLAENNGYSAPTTIDTTATVVLGDGSNSGRGSIGGTLTINGNLFVNKGSASTTDLSGGGGLF